MEYLAKDAEDAASRILKNTPLYQKCQRSEKCSQQCQVVMATHSVQTSQIRSADAGVQHCTHDSSSNCEVQKATIPSNSTSSTNKLDKVGGLQTLR